MFKGIEWNVIETLLLSFYNKWYSTFYNLFYSCCEGVLFLLIGQNMTEIRSCSMEVLYFYIMLFFHRDECVIKVCVHVFLTKIFKRRRHSFPNDKSICVQHYSFAKIIFWNKICLTVFGKQGSFFLSCIAWFSLTSNRIIDNRRNSANGLADIYILWQRTRLNVLKNCVLWLIYIYFMYFLLPYYFLLLYETYLVSTRLWIDTLICYIFLFFSF